MEIPIKTDIFNFYYMYLKTLNIILPCTDKSRKVLSNLMLVKYANKSSYILTKECRKSIRKKLNISESSFNNSIHELKKYKALADNGDINPKLMVYPKDNFNVTFNFKLNENR